MPSFEPPLRSVVDLPATPRPSKRRRDVSDGAAFAALKGASAKRIKIESDEAFTPALPSPPLVADDVPLTSPAEASTALDQAKDVIEMQFSLEILLKHNELRLIEQEMAKCQAALEQLSRCHLIPYPVSCPTPDQMLAISSGKGLAMQSKSGAPVPRWAPPFGVVDGPYARHYAKWLIPDPTFDGVLAEWQGIPQLVSSRAAVEGRTTRNSLTDPSSSSKARPMRGMAGQKLHSLASGYATAKDKAGPCILKRSDGQTVKLVCIDCNRENFSSTQGFINHCRIAHKREFKSHEEAAVQCGHPIEVDEAGSSNTATNIITGNPPEERPSGLHVAPGLVHPLARSDKETTQNLLGRIEASLKLFAEGKLQGVKSIPAASSSTRPNFAAAFKGSGKTPYLSRLLQGKKISIDLGECVDDAKTRVDFSELAAMDEDSDDCESTETPAADAAAVARMPAMRVPTRPSLTPGSLVSVTRPTSSSKGRAPQQGFTLPNVHSLKGNLTGNSEDSGIFEDDEMDVDLSPNTSTSNNAPSLVSDDGEYDDSDDGSSSVISDSDVGSVSDVAEITIEEDDVQALREHRPTASSAAKLKKDEAKHVTFVSPIRQNPKGRRKQHS